MAEHQSQFGRHTSGQCYDSWTSVSYIMAVFTEYTILCTHIKWLDWSLGWHTMPHDLTGHWVGVPCLDWSLGWHAMPWLVTGLAYHALTGHWVSIPCLTTWLIIKFVYHASWLDWSLGWSTMPRQLQPVPPANSLAFTAVFMVGRSESTSYSIFIWHLSSASISSCILLQEGEGGEGSLSI